MERQTAIITCNCTVCKGRSARIGGDGKTIGGRKATPTAIHNMVCIAYSPLSRAASAANGPQPV